MTEDRNQAITELVLHSPQTLREIGAQYGLSPERVREIALRERASRHRRQQMDQEATRPLLQRRVQLLPFTTRLLNCLKNGEIEYVWQAALLSDGDLLKIRNLGRASVAELRTWLDANGITPEIDPPVTPPGRVTIICPRCKGAGHVQQRVKP